VLRATEWTESLRDLVTTILETNLTIQGNRMNVITKKVTSWAAIIAVPTLITGFYGMNVPYPGFSRQAGLVSSIAIMIMPRSCSTSPSSGRTGFRQPRRWPGQLPRRGAWRNGTGGCAERAGEFRRTRREDSVAPPGHAGLGGQAGLAQDG